MKRIVFIVKGDPYSWKAHEAMRVGMAVGINSEVNFIFMKDGVYAITHWNPEKLYITGFDKLLENIDYVNVKLFVEDTSAEERGLKEGSFVKPVSFISIEEVDKFIRDADGVLVW